MPKQPMNNKVNQKGNHQWQDSGSDYHREHASNVADYGGNTQDPIAKNENNTADAFEQ